MSSDGTSMVLGVLNLIFDSDDSGWEVVSNSLFLHHLHTNGWDQLLYLDNAADDDVLGTGRMAYSALNSDGSVILIVMSGNVLLSDDNPATYDEYSSAYKTKSFVSTDNGNTFSTGTSLGLESYTQSLAISSNGSIMLAGSGESGVSISYNYGQDWVS